MLRLPDAWVWDFWLAQDGDTYHLFFLRASRALGEPGRRHMRASVGHAVSTDLLTWTQVADALVPADRPAFDDVAIWTGSVLRGPDQRWHMFYTGAGSTECGLVQRIGHAVSDDLHSWRRAAAGPVLEADPRWYETLGTSSWGDQAWRDPWVFADPGGDGWHMLITARATDGPIDDRGVIGHARSTDLVTWTARPPLTKPGAGFGQLEVPQVEQIDGRTVLLFSCLRAELAAGRQATGVSGGVWAVTGDGPLGPFDPGAAHPVTGSSLYSGRIVRDPQGRPMLLAFRNTADDGSFIGELSDPMPVAFTADGRLTIVDGA
jgi:beta-fructofuranosidase